MAKKKYNFTLEEEVKAKAAKRAKSLKRSLSSHIEYLLEEDLKK